MKPRRDVSVAHLDDEERASVLGLVLEEVLSWMRSLPGTQNLRAMSAFRGTFQFIRYGFQLRVRYRHVFGRMTFSFT